MCGSPFKCQEVFEKCTKKQIIKWRGIGISFQSRPWQRHLFTIHAYGAALLRRCDVKTQNTASITAQVKYHLQFSFTIYIYNLHLHFTFTIYIYSLHLQFTFTIYIFFYIKWIVKNVTYSGSVSWDTNSILHEAYGLT